MQNNVHFSQIFAQRKHKNLNINLIFLLQSFNTDGWLKPD